MSSVIKNIKHQIANEVSPIIASIFPEVAQATSGTGLTFTSQGSRSTDGEPITLNWSLRVPIGSGVEGLQISENTTEAILYPDVNGIYLVTVRVIHPSGAFSEKTASVLVSSIPHSIVRERPDASFLEQGIGSFWSLIENKEAIISLWSEYLKLLSNDFRRMGEAVLSKSIRSIQEGRTVSDIILKSQIDLEYVEADFKISDHFQGTNTGSTTYNTLIHRALALSPTILLFPDTVPSINSIGTDIEIYSNNIGGTYKVNNVVNNKIILSSADSLSVSSFIEKVTGVHIQKNSDIGYKSASSSIEKGNFLEIDGNFIEVLDTYATDSSLPGVNYFKLAKKIKQTKINKVYNSYYSFTARTKVQDLGMTDVLYVPAEELNGKDFFTSETVEVTVDTISNERIKVVTGGPNTFGFGVRAVGSEVTFTNEKFSGHKAKLIMEAGRYGNEYIIYPRLKGADILKEDRISCRASLKIPHRSENLLLCVDEKASLIKNVSYIETANGKIYAAIKCETKFLVSGKSNLSWRISHSLVLPKSMNLEKQGVCKGDTFRIEISNSISKDRTFIDCAVLGSYKNIVSFVLSTDDLTDENGSLVSPYINSEALSRMFRHLNIPGSGLSTNEYIFSGMSKRLKDLIPHTYLLLKYNNVKSSIFDETESNVRNTIHLTGSTILNTEYRICVKAKFIRRNNKIPIEGNIPVISVPLIAERPYALQENEINNGVLGVHKDGTISRFSRKEKVLYDNFHFSLQESLGFYGYDLQKEENSLIVVSESGSFLNRAVSPGALITFNGSIYYIKRVLSESEVEICGEKQLKELKASTFKRVSYSIQDPNYMEDTTYVVFRPGVYAKNNPTPQNLHIPNMVLDNSHQIQNNFGILAGYPLESFYDYSSPQISYKNAILGLMYAWANGPTIQSAKIVSSVLTSLPITEFYSRVEFIDEESGKIVLQELDEFGEVTGREKTYRLPSKETIPPFYTLASNQEGDRIKIGDILPKFTILSGRVSVEDHVNFPKEFESMPIKKWHSWRINVDAAAVDTRDLEFLSLIYKDLKPVYTKPNIVLTVYLLDIVQILVDLFIDSVIRLYDDPGFNLETTHMFDNTNNSGVILRNADLGEYSSRTLMLGKDLVFLSPTSVSSARGGFTFNPVSSFSSTNVGVDPDTKQYKLNSPFSGVIGAKGNKLVRDQDLLYVHTGKNAGMYKITSVGSDTTLDIQPISGSSFYSKTPEADPENQSFTILRQTTPIIIGSIEVSSINLNEITFVEDNLNWEGVAVSDFLVKTNDHSIKTTIIEVPYNPITQHGSNSLKVEDRSIFSVGDTFMVVRDSLIPKSGTKGEVTAWSSAEPYRIEHNSSDVYLISPGDIIVNGNGKEAKIIKVTSNALYISESIFSINDTFTTEKRGRSKEASSDYRLETLMGYDNVTIELTSSASTNELLTATTTPSGQEVRIIQIGSLSTVEPLDVLELLDAGTVVFTGTVHYLSGTSAYLFVEFEDSNISYNIQKYTLRLKRNSKP